MLFDIQGGLSSPACGRQVLKLDTNGLLIFPLFSDSFCYHLSISLGIHKFFESFYEGVVMLVFYKNSAVLIYEFSGSSLAVSEDRDSEEECFYGSDSITFFGQIDESFCLTDYFYLFITIIDPSYKND